MPTTAKTPRRYIRREWHLWQGSMMTLRRLRRDIAHQVSPHGEKWTRKMLAHYDRLLEVKKGTEPVKYID